MGLTDKNHNVKNSRYQNVGFSCDTAMGGYLFDLVLLHISGVTNKLYLPEDFAPDHIVLKLSIHEIIKKLVDLDNINGEGGVSVFCVIFY